MDSGTPTKEELKKLREEVYAYPTDLRRRFQLGVALSAHHKYYEAIHELRYGMCDPHVRLDAMKRLIEVYEARGEADEAASLREQFSRESGDDSSSGSAPVPAPTRPISPRGSIGTKKIPDEDEAV
jgi:hypothetical protein